MTAWINLGQQCKLNAFKFPNRVAMKDSKRVFTYLETNQRVNQLANSLLELGLSRGDKVAVARKISTISMLFSMNSFESFSSRRMKSLPISTKQTR